MTTRAMTSLLGLAGLLSAGCALVYQIEGVANSNVYRTPNRSATFGVQYAYGDPIVAPKVERMLSAILQRNGLTPATTEPQLKVFLAFDVVPAGQVSSARSFVYNPPQTATVVGNQVFTSGGRPTVTTVVSTTQLYTKTIAVLIVDATTGERVWEGTTSETGWCNQIFVTAPHILSLMFERFPREATNVRKMVAKSDPVAAELKRRFPPDTNWGCR